MLIKKTNFAYIFDNQTHNIYEIPLKKYLLMVETYQEAIKDTAGDESPHRIILIEQIRTHKIAGQCDSAIQN